MSVRAARLRAECAALVQDLAALGVRFAIEADATGREKWVYVLPKKAKRACRGQLGLVAILLRHGLSVSQQGVVIAAASSCFVADEIEAALCAAIREADLC